MLCAADSDDIFEQLEEFVWFYTKKCHGKGVLLAFKQGRSTQKNSISLSVVIIIPQCNFEEAAYKEMIWWDLYFSC